MTTVYGLATASALLVAGAVVPFLYRIKRSERPMRLRGYRRYWAPLLLAGAIAAAGGAVVVAGPRFPALIQPLGLFVGTTAGGAILVFRLPRLPRRIAGALVILLAAIPTLLFIRWEHPPAHRVLAYDGSTECLGPNPLHVPPDTVVTAGSLSLLLDSSDSRRDAEATGRCYGTAVASIRNELWWIGRRPLVARAVGTVPPFLEGIGTLVETWLVAAGAVRVDEIVLQLGSDSRFVPRGAYTLLIDIVEPSDM